MKIRYKPFAKVHIIFIQRFVQQSKHFTPPNEVFPAFVITAYAHLYSPDVARIISSHILLHSYISIVVSEARAS